MREGDHGEEQDAVVHHTCVKVASANRLFLERRSAIIFWPRGDSSDDDAGDGSDESNARSREGVIGRQGFGCPEESVHE